MLRIAQTLNGQLRAAMERAFPEAAQLASAAGQALDPQLAPASKPEFGDFQANGALPLAKPWASHPGPSPRRSWRNWPASRPLPSCAWSR